MKKRIGILVLWTLIFYFIFGPLRDMAADGDTNNFYKVFSTFKGALLFSSTFFAFLLYTLGAYLILFYTYPRRKYLVSSILLLCLVPTAIGFRYLLQEVFFDYLFGFTNYYQDPSLHFYFFDNLYYAFVFTGFGVIVFFLRYTNYKDLQRANYEIENQKTQLSLLRSQINPHFIFNALNGIYALVHDKNEKALPAIETMSNLLRYSLYQKEEKVNLKKEWAFIEDYIALQHTRLSRQTALLLDVPEHLPNIKILPFSLIPFVENTFKHGDLFNDHTPIRITINTTSQYFIFKIENVIRQQEKDDTGGIGLINTSKRLALFYDSAHQLSIKQEGHIFQVELKIPLHLC